MKQSGIRIVPNSIQKIVICFFIIWNFIFLIACDSLNKENQTNNERNNIQYSKTFGRVVSLNGLWDLAEGHFNLLPLKYNHKAAVPGIIKNADPKFSGVGFPSNKRETFFYKKQIQIDKQNDELVFIKINKAKYGTKLFINGNEAGYNPLNFTPSLFNITELINNQKENEIVIGVGAHVEQLPGTVSTGGDIEKYRYYPGIYDDVNLIYTPKSNVENIQVVPDINNNKVGLVLYIKNYGEAINKNKYSYKIIDSRSNEVVAIDDFLVSDIKKNELKIHKIDIPFNNFDLWTPETPNLYRLEVSNNNYVISTRFVGMRDFWLDKNYSNKALFKMHNGLVKNK